MQHRKWILVRRYTVGLSDIIDAFVTVATVIESKLSRPTGQCLAVREIRMTSEAVVGCGYWTRVAIDM